MATNAFLIRYANGWHEATSPTSITAHGRREGFLSLGAIAAIREAEAIAAQHFAVFGDTRTQITATQDPIGDSETPYVHTAYVPGATVVVPDVNGSPTAEPVKAITVTEDDDGNLLFSPELGDFILDAEQRFDVQVKKMTDGTLGGYSPQASPAAPS